MSPQKTRVADKALYLFVESVLYKCSGDWIWDFPGSDLLCSDVMPSFSPLENDLIAKALIHPDDLQLVLKAIARIALSEPADISFRIITTYGKIKEIRGAGHFDVEKSSDYAFRLSRQQLEDWEADKLQQQRLDQLDMQVRLGEHAEQVNDAGTWYYNTVTSSTWYSDQYFRIFKLRPQTLNHHLHSFHPFIFEEDRGTVVELYAKSLAEQLPVNIEYRIVCNDLTTCYVRDTTRFVTNHKGEPVLCGTLRDISDWREAEQAIESLTHALEVERQKLWLAERTGRSGSFELNTITRKVTFSDGLFSILGLKPGAKVPGMNTIAEAISIDDRDAVMDTMRQDLEEEKFTPIEFHIVRPDGRKRHIKRTGRIIRNKDNEAIMLGMLHDVTEEEASTTEIQELETHTALLEFVQGQSEAALDSAHWAWNLDNNRIKWSDNFFRLLGYKSRLTEFTHEQLVNHVHAADRPAFSAALREMLHERKETVLSFRYSRKNEIRFARAQFRLHGATGTNFFIGVMNDITAVEHLEQTLKELVNFNDVASNSTTERILITDQNHNITLWNRQFEATYGWKKEKIVGKNFFEVFPELNKETMQLHLKQALAGEAVYLKDYRLTGTKNIVNVSLSPIIDHAGAIRGVLHVMHDNTREYALREELTQRLNFIEKLLEASVDRIIVLDQHMNYVYWNKRAEKHYGLRKEDVTGRNILEVYPAMANEPSYSELRRCLRGETIHIPASQANDDQKGYFETYLIPLRDERRNVTGVLWIVHDLAGQYRLARQQRKAGSILESISEAYLEVDFDGKVRYMNPQAEEMWRFDKEKALGRDIFDLLPDDVAPAIRQLLQRAFDERENLHGELFRPDTGQWLDLSCTVNDEGVIMLFYDITETRLAAEKLKQSNLFIEQVTVTLPDLISIHDIESGDVLYMNRSPLGDKYQHGLPGLRKGSDPASFAELVHPDDREKVLQWLQERNNLRADETAEIEYRLAGNEWIRSRSRIFKSAPDGRPTQLLSIGSDITESKKAELEIRAGKELLQGIIDAPNIGIAVYKAIRDEEGHIIDFVHEFINRRTLELIGTDMTGELLYDNVLQGEQQMNRFIEALETGRPNSYVVEAGLHGGLRWMLFSNAPIDSERLVHVWEDVTQLRKAEMEMEKQTTLLKHTEESAQSGSWEYDIQTGRFTWSDGMYKLFGLPRQMNVRPETYLDFVVEEDRSIAKRIVNYLRKKHESFEETMSIRTHNGGVRQLQIKASVLPDKHGRPEKFMGIDLDITNLRQVELKLKESRLWLEQTSLASPDSISVYDVQKKQPVYLNGCLAAWVGTTSEDLVKIGIEGRLKLIHGEDRLRLLQFNEKMMGAQDTDIHTLEYRIVGCNGRLVWLLNRSKVLERDEHGRVSHFLTVLQDVTEAVHLREELKHRTQYAEAIIDASIDRIAVYDRELKVLAWNRRAEEVTGHKKEQVIGRKLFDVFPAISMDEELLKAHLDALEGNYVQVPVRKGIYTNNIYERFFIPMKDEAGNVYAIINIMHDVSELANRNMELSDLNKTLDQRNRELAQRNEEITHFSFVASHDMKEPLRKIHTFSDWLLLQEHDNLSAEGKKFVVRMNAAVKRMEALIEDILVLTNIHSDRYKEEEVDLEQLLAQVLEEMAGEIGQSKAVIRTDELPCMRGNGNQIFYLFKNLVSNAIKFQHYGNEPEITISHKIVEGDELPQGDREEDYHRISVMDNGLGIDSKYYKKIFQVFQRLHSAHEFEGTGIGLAICKQIMQNHEGFISVESTPNKGSTFHCFFPVK